MARRFSLVGRRPSTRSVGDADGPVNVRIGSFAEIGTKHINYSEDRVKCVTAFSEKSLDNSILTGYAAIFDGHGGEYCADYVNENMLKLVSDSFESDEAWIRGEDLLKDLFHEMDQEYCNVAERKEDTSGACGTVIVVKQDEALVANIGDCRAIKCNNKGKVLKAINDHRAGNDDEYKRISLAGGIVENGRVQSLEPSRTFGDIDVKKAVGEKVIISTPDVERFSFKGSKGDYIIVASDGLWDKVTNKAAAKVCKKALNNKNDPEEAARALVSYAIEQGSNDDISVAVLVF